MCPRSRQRARPRAVRARRTTLRHIEAAVRASLRGRAHRGEPRLDRNPSIDRRTRTLHRPSRRRHPRRRTTIPRRSGALAGALRRLAVADRGIEVRKRRDIAADVRASPVGANVHPEVRLHDREPDTGLDASAPAALPIRDIRPATIHASGCDDARDRDGHRPDSLARDRNSHPAHPNCRSRNMRYVLSQ